MGVNSINGKKQELRLCGMLFLDSLAESEHVQDKLWEERETLVNLYRNGASFYLCGPVALRNSVLAVVKRIYMATAESEEGKGEDKYEEWLARMNRGRFAVDTFA